MGKNGEIWGKNECSSINEWIKKLWSIDMLEYYLAIKKEMLPFATPWMNLESNRLSEISQSEKDE